jgi:hypothetical protein
MYQAVKQLSNTTAQVSLFILQHLQVAVVRVGIDLKLYDLLVASKAPLSVEDIAKTTGASPLLLGPNTQAVKLFNSLMRHRETAAIPIIPWGD